MLVIGRFGFGGSGCVVSVVSVASVMPRQIFFTSQTQPIISVMMIARAIKPPMRAFLFISFQPKMIHENFSINR